MDEAFEPSNSGTHRDRNEWQFALLKQLLDQEARFLQSKKRWNFWYYVSMYGAVIFSALAALVLKWSITFQYQTDAAAILATLSAILGTASSAGNFERRWSAARRALMEIQKLRLDLENPARDLSNISDAYKRVLEQYECAVVGNDA